MVECQDTCFGCKELMVGVGAYGACRGGGEAFCQRFNADDGGYFVNE